MEVVVSKELPVDEVRIASSIKTKELVQIPTGDKIHIYKFANTFMVSSELFTKMKNELKAPKGWEKI